jgi:hypothetical protein
MTNYEKIKNMSVDELARLLDDIATCCNLNGHHRTQMFCKECPLHCGHCSSVDFGCWLNSEVKE